MTIKRAVWVFAWLFLGFCVISYPDQSAALVDQVLCALELGAQRVAVFLSRLF